MALSRLARDFAAEIREHDWSDSPWRLDRAGHKRENDTNRGQKVLSKDETDSIRTNVMWVAAQVLGYNDPNLDVFEFAEACGVDTRTPSGYPRSGHITAGLRGGSYGRYCKPGTWEYDDDPRFIAWTGSNLRDVLRLQPTAMVGPDGVLLIPNPLFREGVAANQPVPMQVAIPLGGIIWRA